MPKGPSEADGLQRHRAAVRLLVAVLPRTGRAAARGQPEPRVVHLGLRPLRDLCLAGGVGAGVEVATESLAHEVAASPLLVAYAIALPVAIFIAVLWLLQVSLGGRTVIRPVQLVPVVAALLLVPLAVGTISIAWVLALIAGIVAALIAVAGLTRRRTASTVAA